MTRGIGMTLLLLNLVACPSLAFVTVSRKSAFVPRRNFHSSTALSLNRFLFDPTEMDFSEDHQPSVKIPKDDYRTIHASKILGLRNGDTIRAGIVSDPNQKEHQDGSSSGTPGLVTDTATIQWLPEGKVKKAEPLGNGNPPGSLRIILNNLQAPASTISLAPVSLILALPRPLQLGRILPMISQMGVDHLVLCEARKVPKDYFGSHLFRHPERLRERLIEGLCQAGDVRLPRLTIVRNLKGFLRDELDDLFPCETYARVLAHPERIGENRFPVGRFDHLSFPETDSRRIVLAVGPEGGWVEPDELDLWDSHNFQAATLGPRVLRSDVAVVALLALAHEACRAPES